MDRIGKRLHADHALSIILRPFDDTTQPGPGFHTAHPPKFPPILSILSIDVKIPPLIREQSRPNETKAASVVTEAA